MTTTAAPAHEYIAAIQTDDNLLSLYSMYYGRGIMVRDEQGRLRSLTPAEAAFQKAVRGEALKRGLVR